MTSKMSARLVKALNVSAGSCAWSFCMTYYGSTGSWNLATAHSHSF